jgi:hypothetical protein
MNDVGSSPTLGTKQYTLGVNGSMSVSKTAGEGSNPSGYASFRFLSANKKLLLEKSKTGTC